MQTDLWSNILYATGKCRQTCNKLDLCRFQISLPILFSLFMAIMQSANEGQNFWTNWPKQKLKACMNLIIVIVLGFWGLMMSSMEWGSVLLSERSGWFSSLITWVLLNVYACHVLLFSSEKIFSNVKSRGWL